MSASSAPIACGSCGGKGLCGGKGVKTLKDGVLTNNPIWVQVMGICSTLAVTSQLENSVVMGLGLVFVLSMSSLVISMIRSTIPHRFRIIAQIVIICTFVIILDQGLKGFYWSMSKSLGPYIGLIITNTLVMGRTEAFALQNPPLLSMVDGAANGLGYAVVLCLMGVVRELLGSGKVLGHTVLASQWYTPNQLAILGPGAFFALGLVIAVLHVLVVRKPPEVKP